jgi:D-alanyl-D-alanine carboxypeptidase
MLQNELDMMVTKYKIPGIQVAISTNNQSWISSSGSDIFNKSIKIKSDSLFKIGSTTKMFMAALILKFVENQRLKLNDPMSKWFPDYPGSNDITIKNLLNHTSGIRNFLEIFSIVSKTFLNSKINWDPGKIINITSKYKPYFPPGTDFHYSNTNYIILGIIAEKITGKKIPDLFKQELFDRYDLNNTFFLPYYDNSSDKLISGIDIDYLPFGPNKIKGRNLSWDTLTFTSGAMISNSEDILKWYDAFFKGKVINSESLVLMQSFLPELKDNPVKEMKSYGLGLAKYEADGDILLGHTGGIMGYEVFPVYCPDKNYMIIIMINITQRKSKMLQIFSEIKNNIMSKL